MADIRIKDLTTLESASLTGDVFVIDGTTGTRKLSAFSPSFGGNATVTGTLTVNGTTASVGAGTGSIISKLNGAAGSYKLSIYQSAGVDRWYAGLAAGAESGSDGGAPYSIVALTDAGAVIDNALLITRAAGGSITTPRPVSISATTASTSTSSGALVVSGGVGVAGAVFTGGYVHPGGDSTFYIRGTGSNNGLIRGNVTSVDVDTSFGVRNGDGSSTYLSVASTGLIAAIPATAPSLTVNGTMTFERTSNTSLKISVRGTDGTTRSVSLTLA